VLQYTRHPLTCSGLVCVQRCEVFVCCVDIGGIVSHQCVFKGVRCEVIVRFVDIDGIISHQCVFKGVRFEVVVYFVDIGGIVSHQCLAI